jgi:hypothetical protein
MDCITIYHRGLAWRRPGLSDSLSIGDKETMREIDKATWEDFEAYVKELRQRHHSSTPLLFRGQDDATYPLTTTLERAGQDSMRWPAYYEMISRFSTEIETLTGIDYDLPFGRMPSLLRNEFPRALLGTRVGTRVYRYMVDLRHYGFPSPLLDWTRSPYVAAYFAFCRVPREPSVTFRCSVCGQNVKATQDATIICGKCHSCSKKTVILMEKNERRVSIYVFSEQPRGVKGRIYDKANIIRCGQFVRAHRRHVLQQSDYSICAIRKKVWHFTPHDEVFDRNSPQQDILTKINIPWTERLKVLKLLDDHNLNAFSLFASKEGLIETIALRALDLGSTA